MLYFIFMVILLIIEPILGLSLTFIIIVFFIIEKLERKKLLKELDKKLKRLEIDNIKEKYSFKYKNWDIKTILVSDLEQVIYIISSKNKNDIKIPFKDILSSEIREKGETVIKTSITSQVGRAAIGGALFGGVGAIIGGTSGNKNIRKSVNYINLLITTTNISNPIYELTFEGKDKFEESRRWHGIIAGIIHKNRTELLSKDKAKDNSFSDELLKLNKLLNDGILTSKEFENCKQRLLRKV